MQNDESTGAIIGTVVGSCQNLLVVRLSGGKEVLCRSLTRLHRLWGFWHAPIGRRVRIQIPPKRKSALIVEVEFIGGVNFPAPTPDDKSSPSGSD